MLQQTQACRFKAFKISNIKCYLQFKYQRCETCKVAVLWEAGDQPAEQIDNSEKWEIYNT